MRQILLTIALGALMLNVNAQEATDATTQGISSLLGMQQEQETKKAEHSLAFSIGPSWITSKIYMPDEYITWRRGVEVMAEYDCVFSKGLGFGVTLAKNYTSYPHGITMDQLYVGPSFVYAGYLGYKWWAKVEIGAGYALYDDNYQRQSGVGIKEALTFDYMVTPKIGLGARLFSITSIFGKQPDDYPGDKDETNGIVRIGLAVGLTIHL